MLHYRNKVSAGCRPIVTKAIVSRMSTFWESFALYISTFTEDIIMRRIAKIKFLC